MGLGENGKALRAGERNNPPQFFFSGRAKICDYLEIAEEGESCGHRERKISNNRSWERLYKEGCHH